MTNQSLIQSFYTAFANHDAEAMAACYADDATFHDPAFGQLQGEDVRDMWRMLLSRKASAPEVHLVGVTEDGSAARWWAKYHYGPKRRMVVNEVAATFVIENGKIVSHTDHFDLWKWSRQALGLNGLLLGWTPFMRNRIQETTQGMLRRYQAVGGRR